MQQQFLRGKLYRFAGDRWDQRTGTNQAYDMIVIGEAVRTAVDVIGRTEHCKGEFVPDDTTYRIDDGHLPDYQPRVKGRQLRGVMGPSKIGVAFATNERPA